MGRKPRFLHAVHVGVQNTLATYEIVVTLVRRERDEQTQQKPLPPPAAEVPNMNDALHVMSTFERFWIGTACQPNNNGAPMWP